MPPTWIIDIVLGMISNQLFACTTIAKSSTACSAIDSGERSAASQLFHTSRLGYELSGLLQRQLFDHLQRLSLGFHSRARAGELLATTPAKLVIWGVLAALIYHCVAGVKHLLMDLGIGESLQGGITAARITFAVAAVLIVLAGVWVW